MNITSKIKIYGIPDSAIFFTIQSRARQLPVIVYNDTNQACYRGVNIAAFTCCVSHKTINI